jgi:hypothetical protein
MSIYRRRLVESSGLVALGAFLSCVRALASFDGSIGIAQGFDLSIVAFPCIVGAFKRSSEHG